MHRARLRFEWKQGAPSCFPLQLRKRSAKIAGIPT
ncbi:hypothetical protein STIAU_6677 [Stigmatella aurantiaca DW4/3-1]|uniref:Uncharacterized protein n=1 Tax=Stigmatella aurantiaca (strain DW4/3-1) TaxID=378806 RepID=Q08MD2_STIAD|nr:hypothetical protein STIAU_6677 [Stigmatella aurantiaca DW4/3-1]